MRYDLKVLWVDDTPGFYKQTKEVLEMYAEDMGVSVCFEYEQVGASIFDRIAKAKKGFKVYDIFFIDYSLSGVVGSDIIRELRSEDVDADILFYSSQHETEIREIVTKNLGSYEGVYVAGRENFEDKSNYLIRKNFRRLLSLTNIRGVLMDQTSENDYAMKSYILEKFNHLAENEKAIISDMLIENIKSVKKKLENDIPKELEKLEVDGIKDIGKTLKLPSYLFPLKLRYEIFEKIVKFRDENVFEENPIEVYMNKIIKARNNLAHKKLEICQMQQYILYYDDIKQYKQRQCPQDCSLHTDSNKIGIEEWEEIRKEVIKFGKCFDEIETELENEETDNQLHSNL